MKQTSKSYSFLIEMLIVILFFSLAVIISMQLFVKAWEKSLESKAANYALTQVQSLLEEERSSNQTLANQTDWNKEKEPKITVQYYNKQWEKVSAKDTYAITILTEIQSRDEAGVMLKLTAQAGYVDAGRNGTEIISLTADQYLSFHQMKSEVEP